MNIYKIIIAAVCTIVPYSTISIIYDYSLSKKYEAAKSENQSKPYEPGLHIFSFGTDIKEKGMALLLQSSPYKITMLGERAQFQDLRDKFYSMRLYLVQHKLHNSKDLILFTDGYDTVFTPGPHDIATKFKAFGKPLVFSAETNCYPYNTPACINKDAYPKSPTIFRYVNSGGYIGEAWAVYKMLSACVAEYNQDTNDQYLANMFFLDNQEWVALDYNQEIFSTLFKTKFEDYLYDAETNQITNLITNSHPVILHGNGKHEKLLRKIYAQYKKQ
jgi:hypothetical protein